MVSKISPTNQQKCLRKREIIDIGLLAFGYFFECSQAEKGWEDTWIGAVIGMP